MKKRGQVWVETVVYTLIGLTIIGAILGIATPKIKQMTDRAIIEQTITAMNQLNEKMIAVQTAAGQVRSINFNIKKGRLIINAVENKIRFSVEDTALKFSQPGTNIRQGDIIILTEEKNGKYDISIILEYGIDIISGNKNENRAFTQAPTAYTLKIENKGGGVIDITPV